MLGWVKMPNPGKIKTLTILIALKEQNRGKGKINKLTGEKEGEKKENIMLKKSYLKVVIHLPVVARSIAR